MMMIMKWKPDGKCDLEHTHLYVYGVIINGSSRGEIQFLPLYSSNSENFILSSVNFRQTVKTIDLEVLFAFSIMFSFAIVIKF